MSRMIFTVLVFLLVGIFIFTVSCEQAAVFDPNTDNPTNVDTNDQQGPAEPEEIVYVSPYGNDIVNTGTQTYPLLSIQRAIEKSVEIGTKTIYVQQGVYTRGNGLVNGENGISITNDGLTIIGGWDSNFVDISSYSVLDGGLMKDARVVYVGKVLGLRFTGFIVRGGWMSSGWRGGGMYVALSSNITISNCVFSNNIANAGGGMFCYYISNSMITNVETAYNTSQAYGGGFYLSGWLSTAYITSHHNKITPDNHELFRYEHYKNNWLQVGAGAALSGIGNKIVGDIYSNECHSEDGGGGLALLPEGSTNAFYGNIFGNIALQGGGVVLSGMYNSVSGKVSSNTATNGNGGGILMEPGGRLYGPNEISAEISHNYAHSYDAADANSDGGKGGGIAFGQTTDRGYIHKIYGKICSNLADHVGGGFFTPYSGAFSIEGDVFRNESRGEGIWNSGGGGIFVGGSVVSNSENRAYISANVYNNYSSNSGGGIYIYSSNATITGSVYDNYAAENGGGIVILSGIQGFGVSDYSDNIIIFTGFVQNNTAGREAGGMIISGGGSTVMLSNVISGNRSGMALDSANSASYAYGGRGAIMLQSAGRVFMSNLSIYGNTAFSFCAAIGSYSLGVAVQKELVIYNTYISNNTATTSGSAIYFSSDLSGEIVLDRVYVSENRAKSYGPLYIPISKPDANNYSSSEVYPTNTFLTIKNSLFTNNYIAATTTEQNRLSVLLLKFTNDAITNSVVDISNNVIAGVYGSTNNTGIYEIAGDGDARFRVLMNNTFVYNTIRWLLHDSATDRLELDIGNDEFYMLQDTVDTNDGGNGFGGSTGNAYYQRHDSLFVNAANNYTTYP